MWARAAGALQFVFLMITADVRAADAQAEIEAALAACKEGRYADAVPIFRRLAGEGNAERQYWPGHAYDQGRGVAKDPSEAKRWYGLAAMQRHTEAKAALARLAGMEACTTGDAATGHWFDNQPYWPDAEAMAALSLTRARALYASGDFEGALIEFRALADQGHAGAQLHVGEIFRDRRRSAWDLIAAHMWLDLAASGLSGELRQRAVDARDGIARRLTSEQLASARRCAREWRPVPRTAS